MISIGLFFRTYGLLFLLPPSERISRFSHAESPARSNFLITATIFIPLGWLSAQLLLQLFFNLDLGALTCGAVFHYDRKLNGGKFHSNKQLKPNIHLDLEDVTSIETTAESQESSTETSGCENANFVEENSLHFTTGNLRRDLISNV